MHRIRLVRRTRVSSLPDNAYRFTALVTLPLLLLAALLIAGCASSNTSGTASSGGHVTVEYDAGAEGAVDAAETQPADEMPEITELEAETDESMDELATVEVEELEEPATPEPVDPTTLLDESLEAFESSQVFWDQGNFDDAFAALDRSYELMAQVPLNGDPYIAQEKEDLRHLISRRIIEIYASRRTTVGDMDKAIPVEVNQYVEREIKSFQGPERKFFLESYQRSGLYRDMIVEELKAAGLPEQISWLPLVESGFKSLMSVI